MGCKQACCSRARSLVPLPLRACQCLPAPALALQPAGSPTSYLPSLPCSLAVLLGLIVATIWQSVAVDPTAGKLMLPYFAWTGFAAALTYKIRELNRDSPDAKTE